jgi:hypothetical protein
MRCGNFDNGFCGPEVREAYYILIWRFSELDCEYKLVEAKAAAMMQYSFPRLIMASFARVKITSSPSCLVWVIA